MSEIAQRKEKIKSDLAGFEKKMENIMNPVMMSLSHIRFTIVIMASIAVKETDGDKPETDHCRDVACGEVERYMPAFFPW